MKQFFRTMTLSNVMLLLVLSLMLLNLQSCGKNDILPTHDIKKTFGFNYDDKMNNLDDEIEALKKRVGILEAQMETNKEFNSIKEAAYFYKAIASRFSKVLKKQRKLYKRLYVEYV